MILNRLAGGCMAAISFLLFTLVMLSRGSSATGVEVMNRLGLPFVLLFLAAQVVLCLVFVSSKDRLVPLLIFAGGSVLYVVLTPGGGGASEIVRIPLHFALIAGASFSGLAVGALVMIGEVKGTSKK